MTSIAAQLCRALVGILVCVIIALGAGWQNQDWLKERVYAMGNVEALATTKEQSLKPGDRFKECTDCPEMVFIPAGSFKMGSPGDEGTDDERPQHKVTIGYTFAVSRYEVAFDEWDACVAHGDCDSHIRDSGFGRGRQPAININWYAAQTYAAWLNRITSRPYRLLSEAEYEYAARAGTETMYPWGDGASETMAKCVRCYGPRQDGTDKPAPVGLFPPNRFGLYDMVGNVSEWVEDCFHPTYEGAPTDGSPWTGDADDCAVRVRRSSYRWDELRFAFRDAAATDIQNFTSGFRVARTMRQNRKAP